MLPRTYIRNLYLRLLGLIFLAAFLSLYVQIVLLVGRDGLLPAGHYLQAMQRARWFDTPTVFWFGCSDAALNAAAIAGAALSLGLILNVAPRHCLVLLWGLYLSFVSIGQQFLSFQWDNLLLESAFFSIFIAPRGVRARHWESPHPLAIFLMQWLLFRLHVESGAAKLLTGDETWRNLTAMVNYYETAPLPTWVGWYAHQMPLWAHKASALFTFVVELGLPLFIWGPRRVRVPVFVLMIGMQVSIALTANYGYFNYLSMALCLFVLDDRDLAWAARRVGVALYPRESRRRGPLAVATFAAVGLLLALLSLVPFSHFLRLPPSVQRQVLPLQRVANSFRSVNAYHLIASMTLVRREVVIEGSDDGEHWLPYEFRYKAGDVDRPPPFVAPHQPRVDFQLWFLLLGGAHREAYFDALLQRLLHQPAVVAPLFSRDPFPERPPRRVRVAAYQYWFTDAATRRATGVWWRRSLIGYSQPIAADG